MVSVGAATMTEGVVFTAADVPAPDTLSGIVTGVPFVAVTLPVTVIGGKLWPAASASLRVHVVVDSVQDQPVPLIAVPVNPVGGSTSVTVPLVAALPVFVTVML